MTETLQTEELATENLWVLAYMQHMAQTAQPAAAKRLYELFAQQEKQQIEAKGGIQIPAPAVDIGVPKRRLPRGGTPPTRLPDHARPVPSRLLVYTGNS